MDQFAIYILTLLLFAEILVSWTWMGFYFRYGLPVYRRKVRINKFGPKFAEELERMHHSNVSLPLLFRAISRREIAFREKAYGIYWLRYAPVIRGLIHVSKDSKEIYITGLLNWYVILLIVFLPLMLALDEVWPYYLVILAAVSIIYAIQRYRFGEVGNNLEKLYGNQHHVK